MGPEAHGRAAQVAGMMPYRAALAGGWIDQPFISKHNTEPPGSMVVVSLEPDICWMDRAGMATGTRHVALKIWGDKLPSSRCDKLVEELYAAENNGKQDPSGSQDMIGLVYPGISRLDYDFNHKGGIFPCHIESCNDPEIARWLESVLHVVPVAPRPDGYNPLGVMNLDTAWIRRLGQTGRKCYNAIVAGDVRALGDSMNECMLCWMSILPQTVSHPLLKADLSGLLRQYQSIYAGAMYSGCGGGYLYVVSDDPVPGSFKVRVRISEGKAR